MIASNVPITTASTALFPLLPSTRELILSNSSTSAGNATFTVTGDQSAGFADQVVAPGASVTLSVQPGLTAAQLGTLAVSAASTATVTAQRVPY